MKQFSFQVVLLLILIFGGLLLTTNRQSLNTILPGSNTAPGNQNKVNLKIYDPKTNTTKAIIQAELADSQEKRSKGLGGRDSLAKDEGMLFIFEQTGNHNFWMKGMRFPLDFIYIQDDTVLDISQNIPNPDPNQTDDKSLPTYPSPPNTNKILEVKSGYAQEHNIQKSDKIETVQEVAPSITPEGI